MGKFENSYKEKLTTAEGIASLVKTGDVCASPMCMGEPLDIINAIGDRVEKGEITNIVQNCNFVAPGKCYEKPEMFGKFDYISWFFSASTRKGGQDGRFDYMQANYNDFPRFFDMRGDIDRFFLVVSPMDEHGYFSMGAYVGEAMGIMRKAKHIYVEVNKFMPRTFGENFIHISEVEAICEKDEPIYNLQVGAPTEKDYKIGNYIADMVPDGATLQFGIGGVSGAMGEALKDKKDLGIHTEMFSDAMVDLIEMGAVTNEKKNINRRQSVSTFCFGSKKVYDYINNNPSLAMLPIEYVNDPYIIAKNDNFISVNAGLEVDFLGQVCSESIGDVPYSGSGGQFDYVKGAKMSKGGISFIAMNSTAKNDTISRIKPCLTYGAAVTTHKNEVNCIVTEYGVAQLMGKSVRERTKALINIAHPKFREELLFEAKKRNILI
ncbi:MAG: 4-hydroxybutyrate--acetyl-CoA CoA transferase [Clostridia bacterium]|jgi:acyl-CoA hydrolase|nr:4-hydroxybutyrate--acetyl-CoA CoA transferase [Clostridia bacterium]MCI1999267.1 4-hydroxybutyrate--acetyl-CoA CoA transferase [Clostridia bacterium]MCI2014780.1 4-hydroxybutyrate--acetyl-CoA CoA transferase [Clostridia bacterium]